MAEVTFYTFAVVGIERGKKDFDDQLTITIEDACGKSLHILLFDPNKIIRAQPQKLKVTPPCDSTA